MSLLTTGGLDKITFEGAFQPNAICESVSMQTGEPNGILLHLFHLYLIYQIGVESRDYILRAVRLLISAFLVLYVKTATTQDLAYLR